MAYLYLFSLYLLKSALNSDNETGNYIYFVPKETKCLLSVLRHQWPLCQWIILFKGVQTAAKITWLPSQRFPDSGFLHLLFFILSVLRRERHAIWCQHRPEAAVHCRDNGRRYSLINVLVRPAFCPPAPTRQKETPSDNKIKTEERSERKSPLKEAGTARDRGSLRRCCSQGLRAAFGINKRTSTRAWKTQRWQKSSWRPYIGLFYFATMAHCLGKSYSSSSVTRAYTHAGGQSCVRSLRAFCPFTCPRVCCDLSDTVGSSYAGLT